jgi:nucleoside-diphosphate-sugar epimerase
VITIHITRCDPLATYVAVAKNAGGLMTAKKKYLVVGTGVIGSLVAEQLAADGHSVTTLSRRGTGPANQRIKSVAGNAADAKRLTDLAEGCAAIFNCANPPYHRWPEEWPPIADALLTAAERSGAVLVTLNNLYAYGTPSGPLKPETPLRATYAKGRVRGQMWLDAKAAHDEKRLRATEVRSSDFIGPNATEVSVITRVVPDILAGKNVRVLGSADQPHTWSYTVDVARTLIACANNKVAWGRVWHVPSNPPRTQREVVDELADAAGVKRVKASVVPMALIRIMGLFSAMMRELPITMYQFEQPFVMDDSATRKELVLTPTPWKEVLAKTVGK